MAYSNILTRTRPERAEGMALVRLWLLCAAALVFLMVTVGGATRLTGSGLSITEWQPIIGVVPPLSAADWHQAFAKYQEIPQYQHVNSGMSLAEFKFIYWWEWAHRFLGRLIGIVFVLPLIGFLAAGLISRALLAKLVGVFVLGGLQGAVGWYMVSSGLSDRTDVSQYRLALHLAIAIAIFGLLLWIALSLNDKRAGRPSERAPLPWSATAILALVFCQIVLGALVAGLRAGFGYNTWPLMEGQLIPGGLGVMRPWYMNLFENAMTVQFDHRLMAYVLLGAALWNALWRLRKPGAALVRRSAAVLAIAVLAQAALGVWTLLAHVPLALGLAHQALAVIVFAVAVWHLHAASESTA